MTQAVKEELTRLSYTDIQSAEFSVIRNYIDWVVGIPWDVLGPDQMNLTQAKHVLDEDHYGLKDVKDRILEFIAVGKLQATCRGRCCVSWDLQARERRVLRRALRGRWDASIISSRWAERTT